MKRLFPLKYINLWPGSRLPLFPWMSRYRWLFRGLALTLVVLVARYLDCSIYRVVDSPGFPISFYSAATLILLFRVGPGAIPWVFVGSIIGFYCFRAVLVGGIGLVAAFAVAGASIAGSSVAAYLLCWKKEAQQKFEIGNLERWLFGRLAGVCGFVLVAAILFPIVSVSVIPFVSYVNGVDVLARVQGYWILFVFGRAVSVICLVPAFFAMTSRRPQARVFSVAPHYRILLFVCTTIASVLVFCDTVPESFAPRLIQVYWFLPFVGLAPLFLTPRELSGCLITILLVGVYGTYRGLGVFGGLDPILAQLHLESFLFAINAVSLIISAAAREKQRYEEKLKAQVSAAIKAEERALGLATRLRTAIDTAADAIVSVDENGLIGEWNPRAQQMFGWSREDVLATPITQSLFSQEFYNGVIQNVLVASSHTEGIDEKPKTRGEVTLPTASGKRIPVELVVCPGIAGDRGFTIFAQDVSERRVRQQLLVLQTERLAKANEDLQGVVQTMSHDLKSPLNTISNYLQLLMRKHGSELSVEASGFVETAIEGALKLAARIDEVLVGKSPVYGENGIESVDLNCVLDRVFSECRADIQQSRAVITRERMPTVRGREAGLHLIFQNLITNALKYAKPSSIPRIHVSAQVSDGHWIFAISDDGIGIVEADMEKIFQPFGRGDAVQHISGAGLGLATVRQLVEKMNGEVWLESTVGMGSTFYFALPKEVLKRERGPELSFEVANTDNTATFQVLIIDDSATDVALLKHIFISTGSNVEVTAIQDAGEAVEYLTGVSGGKQHGIPHLIVLDLNLPIRSGIEVLKEIRDHHTTFAIPVVMLSGSQREDDIVAAYEAGASGYIVKPTTLDEFERVVRTIQEYWFAMVRYPASLGRTGMRKGCQPLSPEIAKRH